MGHDREARANVVELEACLARLRDELALLDEAGLMLAAIRIIEACSVIEQEIERHAGGPNGA